MLPDGLRDGRGWDVKNGAFILSVFWSFAFGKDEIEIILENLRASRILRIQTQKLPPH